MQQSKERLDLINESDTVYYWSIRHRKLMKLTAKDFEILGPKKCDICIPLYDATHLSNQLQCELILTSLNELKSHITICENHWKRQLMWSEKSEIPTKLDRTREIGDLSILRYEKFLTIKFNTVTLCDDLIGIRRFIQLEGCPCKNETVSKCKLQALKNSTSHLFSHLSHLERKNRKYMVFKADSSNLKDSKLKNSFEQNLNESGRLTKHLYITPKLLDQVLEKFSFLKNNNYSIGTIDFESDLDQDSTKNSNETKETVNLINSSDFEKDQTNADLKSSD